MGLSVIFVCGGLMPQTKADPTWPLNSTANGLVVTIVRAPSLTLGILNLQVSALSAPFSGAVHGR